jgi:large repetitive protein
MNKWLRARMGDRNFHIMKWIASVAVFSMLIITAVVSAGYQSQRVNLDDGSVWVSNAQEQAIGRANTKVQELNTVLTTESADMVLLQNSSLVVVVNEATRSLDVVSEATGEVTEKIPLPQGVTSVKCG